MTAPGDLFQLDGHRILCADATDGNAVKRLFDGEAPNLMVTEPPYEINYSPYWKEQLASSPFPDNIFLRKVWEHFPGNICYVWHSSVESSKVEKTLRDFKFECQYEIVWPKKEFVLSGGNYHWQHDACWYAVKTGASSNWQGGPLETTLWTAENGDCDWVTKHPAQQHLECSLRPIRHSSARGDAVYEPFCGSGSTLIACEHLGRRCFALELSPRYCDEVIRRWIRFRKRSGKTHSVLRNGIPTDFSAESTKRLIGPADVDL